MINFMSGAVQNKYLGPLVCDNLRPYHTVENVPYFCIPKDFIKSWQTSVANFRKKLKPIMIYNKSLLCQDHNELLFEPTSNFFATEQSVSVIITKEEWLNLLDFYRADCGVFAYFDKYGIFKNSIPKVNSIPKLTKSVWDM
ncbi:unnamed protein product [Macrosiphum euphorbiae]|uniref:Uncharacterized protein n=1 Tax=Macrosiphum euphorbiae TaxID=13131 RepID=A0AAV0WY78_9HEMI|nr:unnamed protein product [Macrosiphum euphorbiae]